MGENAQVEALIAGRLIFDTFRKKGYTLEQLRIVAKAIYDSVNDERERLDSIGKSEAEGQRGEGA